MSCEMSETEKPEQEEWPPRKKKIPRRDWESAIEKQIREAMERGDFDNLPGRGKPLDLRRDPHVPPEWEAAFRLLKDAGYAPAWIEQDKEIRAKLEELYRPLQAFLARLPRSEQERRRREGELIADFRALAARLNREIDLFNLQAPSPRVHRPRIRIEDEVSKFKQSVADGMGYR